MLGRCFGETDRGLPAAPSGCLGWIFLPLETSSRNLLMEFHRTVVKVTLDWFRNVSRCVFRGIPQRVYRGFKRMCSWGWRSHFRVVIGGWLCLLEMLLLGALKWGLKGVLKETLGRVSRTQRGVRRVPERGSGEGDIFASKCILKVEYAKDAYIPGLEITRFAPKFRGFWQKLGFECNNSP